MPPTRHTIVHAIARAESLCGRDLYQPAAQRALAPMHAAASAVRVTASTCRSMLLRLRDFQRSGLNGAQAEEPAAMARYGGFGRCEGERGADLMKPVPARCELEVATHVARSKDVSSARSWTRGAPRYSGEPHPQTCACPTSASL